VTTGRDVVFICVSDFANLCRPCASTSDCKSPSGVEDVCVSYGQAGSFCGGNCLLDDDCPWGFSCEEAQTVDGILVKQCIAGAGECPCTGKSVALALWTPCELANEWGVCSGKRVCTPGGLSACDAASAAEEQCNGLDEDCDGAVDEPKEKDGDLINLCDDGNECTKDLCKGSGGCQHEVIEGECKDGDPCTAGDHCQDGSCVGNPVICDDDNACTDDKCDGLGGCVFENNTSDCDDQDPCTVADECEQGVCLGVALACDCFSDTDCAALDDGNECNGSLRCDTTQVPHECVVDPETVVECPDPAPGKDAICLKSYCDPVSGKCSLVPDHEGAACEDGNPCTVGEKCVEGACTGGSPPNCSDDNPCTTDSCDPVSGCKHQLNNAPCDDSNACTLQDACVNGKCVFASVLSCEDGNICTDNFCDPVKGCVSSLNKAPCDDGSVCTTGDHCHLGACISSGMLTCNDGNPCTDDSCENLTGCAFKPNSAPCDDGSACTVNDKCSSGACKAGAPLSCDDANACTFDACDPATGCQHTPAAGACDDLDQCTVNDKCDAGKCAPGAILPCNDGNPCTDDSCAAEVGCVFVPNNAACTDGNACTGVDQCSGGSCLAGAPIDCNDGQACTQDSCDAVKGCVHQPVPDGGSCGPDMVCFGGTCTNCKDLHGQKQLQFTGDVQTFTVPECVYAVKFDAYGAEGGTGSAGKGGLGGRVEASLAVQPGQVFQVFVGGRGDNSPASKGGFNGGGKGVSGSSGCYDGGGGGGATDVRSGGTALSNRILVVGGGGGGGGDGCDCQGLAGGAGGGLTAGDGQKGKLCICDGSGKGGTQSAGGAKGEWDCNDCDATPGSLGQGGNGNTITNCGGTTGGGGGGGGYYGGGGGGLGAGGGGSSYTTPGASNIVHSPGVRAGHGQLTLSW